jgi:predicted Rossmann fold flavoprotein
LVYNFAQLKKIAVVGGGPAGMMAAIRAGELGQDVTLIEKNPTLGKKLLLSGKGRCNLTNTCELGPFLNRFSKNGQFLRDAFKKFFNQDLIDFFEKRGLKLKVERQMRVFPATDKSDSVLGVLRKELEKGKVKVLYRTNLKDLVMQNKRIRGVLVGDGRFIMADKVILATGGISYAFTGSTGDGLKIAAKFGHHIINLRPGLVPLVTRQKYLLEGLVLKNIRIKFCDGERAVISEVGELLFTDVGISGPMVLTLSGKITDWLMEGKQVFAEIDLKPALTAEQLNARLLREFKINSKRTLKNALKELLPLRLIEVFLDITRIDSGKKVSQVTAEERQCLIRLLKGLHLGIIRPEPIEEAMVTRGGVSLGDINPRTMESRLIHGLYFAGEMIDVDADTGGFNLQAAFSTGYLAGESAALS